MHIGSPRFQIAVAAAENWHFLDLCKAQHEPECSLAREPGEWSLEETCLKQSWYEDCFSEREKNDWNPARSEVADAIPIDKKGIASAA